MELDKIETNVITNSSSLVGEIGKLLEKHG
jgi:hypothetical protein